MSTEYWLDFNPAQMRYEVIENALAPVPFPQDEAGRLLPVDELWMVKQRGVVRAWLAAEVVVQQPGALTEWLKQAGFGLRRSLSVQGTDQDG